MDSSLFIPVIQVPLLSFLSLLSLTLHSLHLTSICSYLSPNCRRFHTQLFIFRNSTTTRPTILPSQIRVALCTNTIQHYNLHRIATDSPVLSNSRLSIHTASTTSSCATPLQHFHKQEPVLLESHKSSPTLASNRGHSQPQNTKATPTETHKNTGIIHPAAFACLFFPAQRPHSTLSAHTATTVPFIHPIDCLHP